MDSLGELLLIQLFYIGLLIIIIKAVIQQQKKTTFYWVIVGLYLLTMVWLVAGYIDMPKTGNVGYGFAIGMNSIIVPGILTLTAVLVHHFSKPKNKSL